MKREGDTPSFFYIKYSAFLKKNDLKSKYNNNLFNILLTLKIIS
jgi:hypothetical protein